MARVAVVIPTIDGREEDLYRCVQAYDRTMPEGSLRYYIEHGHPSCGEAWIAGAEKACKDGFDYLHLTADDLEPHPGWLPHAVEAVDKGYIPAPLVYHPSGELESAGLQGFGCYTGLHADWGYVEGTTVPFLAREMWDRIGMIPTHYCTDLWVSARGRDFGYETVVRTGMRFTHHTAQAGRNYGRVSDDTREYLRALEAVR
jgi:hypothetical protein